MKLSAFLLSSAIILSGMSASAQSVSVRPPATGVPGKIARFTLQNWKFDGVYDVRAVAVQPDRKVVIAGKFKVSVPMDLSGTKFLVLNNIIRINEDGSLDTTFIMPEATTALTVNEQSLFDTYNIIEWGPNGTVHTASVDSSDGDFTLLFGGDFTAYGKINPADAPAASIRNRMLDLNRDGELGTTIPTEEGFNAAVRSTTRVSQNDFIIGGDFTLYNGADARYVARVTTGNSVGLTWEADANAPVNASLVDGDLVYIGGAFTSVDTNNTNFLATRVARLDLATGAPDTTFDINTAAAAPNDDVLALAKGNGSSNEVVVVGKFTQMGATAKGHIAALDDTGALDVTFPAANNGNSSGATGGDIKSIVRLPDGRYVIAGSFTAYNGITAYGLARLESDGRLDTTFAVPLEPTTGGDIRHVGTTYSGDPFASIVFSRYYVAGSFTKFSGAGGIVPINGGRYPVILTQPSNTVATLGDPTTLTVSASDNYVGLVPMDTLSYQWQKNGSNIPGATAAFLNIPAASTSTAGTYRVVVSNTIYSVASDPVTVTVVNPFVGVIPATGFTAAGRIDGAALNQSLGGKINLTVNSSGAATGTLTMAGPGGTSVVSRFTGQFNSAGQLTTTIARRNMGPLYLSLKMDLTGAPADFKLNDGLSTVSDGISTAVIRAWNNRWSTTNLATAYAGNYNVGLVTNAADQLVLVNVGLQTRPKVSQGYGFLKMTIGATKGDARIAGTLADGSKFTATSIIWGDTPGTLPLWVPLYRGTGSLLGSLSVNSALPSNPVTASLLWTKPAGVPNSPDAFGLTSVPVTASAQSGLYDPLQAVPLLPPGNLSLSFDDGIWTVPQGGLVTVPFTQLFSVVGTTVVPDAPVQTGMSARINPATGLITGRFLDNGRTAKFQALVLTQGSRVIRGNLIMPNAATTPQYWIGGSVSE